MSQAEYKIAHGCIGSRKTVTGGLGQCLVSTNQHGNLVVRFYRLQRGLRFRSIVSQVSTRRDHDRCEDCGQQPSKHYWLYGRVLPDTRLSRGSPARGIGHMPVAVHRGQWRARGDLVVGDRKRMGNVSESELKVFLIL